VVIDVDVIDLLCLLTGGSMPIYLQAPTHNPQGRDGEGWNRMAIHATTMDECALKPKTLPSFMDALDTRKVRYGSYGVCSRAGSCQDCPTAHQASHWRWFGEQILVREDEHGNPWIMNRPDKGWEEFSKPTTWEHLLTIQGAEFKLYSDQSGRGIMLSKTRA
jgi:hypothetical protein